MEKQSQEGPKPRGSGRPEGAPAWYQNRKLLANSREEAKTKIDTAKASPKKKRRNYPSN
jgi:hypothetical protein